MRMAAVLYPPLRPQSVGEILDSAFRIFTATLLKCLPYALLVVIVRYLTTIYDLATGHPIVQSMSAVVPHDGLWWVLFLIATLGTMTLTNAILLRQHAIATGHPLSVAAELVTGARRVPGMILIAVLLGLAIVGTLIPVLLIALPVLGSGLGLQTRMSAGFVWGLAGVFLLLVICASWVVVRWVCSGPVYLLTDRGPVESMSYSWRLTAGSFWRLSVVYAVGVVLILVLYVLAAVFGGFITLVFAHGDVVVLTAASAVAITLLSALVTPFYSALLLAVFGDVSVRREGADLARRISAPATP
jgi:Membrane domain of glycerophosphoryl diester phosphodiesterase